MALAALLNIPGTAEELAQWSFAHAAHHLDIINAIYHASGLVMPQYILDPFNPKDPNSVESWTYLHQQMHQNQNLVLGIEGQDLTEVDWQDPGLLAGWIQANFAEHLEASKILGVA